MWKKMRYSLLLLVCVQVGAYIAYRIRDYDFEGNLGVGIGTLLIGFLAITYIPLAILYFVKKRNGTLRKVNFWDPWDSPK